MTFDDLEQVWGNQPAASPGVDTAALKRGIESEMRRRTRMLAYEIGANVFCLAVLPLLAIANYRHDPARYGTPWALAHMMAQFLIITVWVAFSWRRMKRHRALQRRRVESVRAMTELSLKSLEAEMRDCRFWELPIVWLSAASVTAALSMAVVYNGWRAMLLPGAMTLGLIAVVLAVIGRHYRVNLRPAYERMREVLRQLGGEGEV